MAAATTTEIFPCTPDQLFSILTDYEKYPEFLTEVKDVKMLKTEGERKLGEFTVSVIKSFSYRLWMSEVPGKKVSWVLDSGDIFKTSTGSWVLEDLGGKTKAVYSVDATFKVFVPGMVAKALVNVNLPNMMKAYQERVRSKYGQK